MGLLHFLRDNWVDILATLAALNLAGQAIARWTKTQADDQWFAKIGTWLKNVGSLGLRPARKSDQVALFGDPHNPNEGTNP